MQLVVHVKIESLEFTDIYRLVPDDKVVPIFWSDSEFMNYWQENLRHLLYMELVEKDPTPDFTNKSDAGYKDYYEYLFQGKYVCFAKCGRSWYFI